MNLKAYIIAAVLLSSVAIRADNISIVEDTPSIGDTTYIETVITSVDVITNNLISQDFADGSWYGTLYPDNSDLNHSTYLTGKENTYAETIINSEDYLTLEELKLGLASTFGADIRWWSQVPSTVTMYQIATNNDETITQSITLSDTTNYSYEFNDYNNTLIINPNTEMSHGTLKAGFEFDILDHTKLQQNGGHIGVDITDPYLSITHKKLTTLQNTSVIYCYEKTPPTCVGYEEIEEVNEVIDTIAEEIFEIITIIEPDEQIINDIEPDINLEVIEIDEVIEVNPIIENVELENVMTEMVAVDEIPVNEEIIIEAEVITEDIIEEEITTENIIEEFEAIEEEIIEEEIVEIAEEIVEEEEIIVEEEIVQEETIEVASEEEIVEEEIIEEEVAEEEIVEENTVEIKKAKLEKIINEKDLEQVQKVGITLEAVNIMVSQEIIKAAVDISAFQNNNSQALFTAVDIPLGVSINNNTLPASYFNNAYEDTVLLANMVQNDPLASHDIAVNQAVNQTNKKLAIYRRLLNAKSN